MLNVPTYSFNTFISSVFDCNSFLNTSGHSLKTFNVFYIIYYCNSAVSIYS